MVINFSGQNIMKKCKLYTKIIILLIIVFYILPKLLSILWYLIPPEEKIRQEHLIEKPMRVSEDIIKSM
ncbi:hypothetical protein SAMN04490355_101928 [Pelosinus propionicus DSM 13327]|uniref:Uncharacterized protein n=1 Tax=Pelosinus propionicus DSM 13327 TaxID=1123291 RepID=A0A1I4KQL1_9FIRM|nr:hypothetical protein SAMN04490355_101928 [Pelosinus propionicus DSM 13327]